MPFIGQTIGDYRITDVLGSGGFGFVLLGENIHDPTLKAAIKVANGPLASQDQQKFFDEARNIASLRHPNIVQLMDYGLYNNAPYLIMEYAPKGSLRDRYPMGSRVSLPTVVAITTQVASALQYVHNHGLIHRDLKPENILINAQDDLLLTDFGIAVSQFVTTVTNILGTLNYMAPELIRRKPHVNSDQYALAIMVYELLTGSFPFQGVDTLDLARQHLTATPPSPRLKNPSIPAAIEPVLQKALEKDPTQRYGTIREFAEELERASTQRGVPPVQPHPGQRPQAPGGNVGQHNPVVPSPPQQQFVPPAQRLPPQQRHPPVSPARPMQRQVQVPPRQAAPKPVAPARFRLGSWAIGITVVALIALVLLVAVPLLTSNTYEAESSDNTTTGPTTISFCYQCSGQHYLALGANATLQFNNVSAPGDGTYDVTITYCAVNVTGIVLVNGKTRINVTYPASGIPGDDGCGPFSDSQQHPSEIDVHVPLHKGNDNTILLTGGDGTAFDKITVHTFSLF